MSQISRMTCASFFTKYITDPSAKELSPKQRKIALLFSVIIGLLTFWIYHAIVAVARSNLDRQIVRLPSQKFDPTIFKIKDKAQVFQYLQEFGEQATTADLGSGEYTPDEVAAVVELCPHLEDMVISTDAVPQHLLRRIKRLPKLNTLDLRLNQPGSGQGLLQVLQNSNRSKRWSVSYTSETQQGDAPSLESIRQFSRVELYLFNQGLTCDQIVREIAGSPHLKTLGFSVEELSEDLADAIQKMKELETLTVHIKKKNSGLPAALFERLLNALKLSHLNLNIVEFNKELSDRIKASKLVSFGLEITDLPRNNLREVAAIQGLKSFSLSVREWSRLGGFPLGLLSVLGELQKSSTLESLTLERCTMIDPNPLSEFAKFPALRFLKVPNLTEIDSKGLEKLADCRHLRTLVLSSFVPQPEHREAIRALHRKKIRLVTHSKTKKS